MEEEVTNWFNAALDGDPQKLIELYAHLNGGQILKCNLSPLELTIINEDNEITEVNCWLRLVTEISHYVYEGYFDDVEVIFNFLVDRNEIKDIVEQ